MADPLSIAAGVVGLLTAAAQISTLLATFTASTKNAPEAARVVLTEVGDIEGILKQLQSFLEGKESSNRSGARLLQIDQVVKVITGCVLTFSELENLLDKLMVGAKGVLKRMQWARKEKAIKELIQRLQNHKGSLSIALHVLNG